jgi:hypothetical protein
VNESRYTITLFDAKGEYVTSCDFADAESESAKQYRENAVALAKEIGGRVEPAEPEDETKR